MRTFPSKRALDRLLESPASGKSQEMLILGMFLNRYPESIEVFELAAVALQYGRAVKALRDAGCVIPNSFFRVSATGERKSRYRLIWCPAQLAPENHPATCGPRPDVPVKRTRAEHNLRGGRRQIERGRTLALKPGPDTATARSEPNPDAITFRRWSSGKQSDPSTPSQRSIFAEGR